MPYDWPEETDFALWELDVTDRNCPRCGRMMHVCDHRYRRFHTLKGPVELLCRLDRCPDPNCPGHTRTKSPETEVTLAPPKWAIGWDVFCWIGHRRCSRPMAIPLIGQVPPHPDQLKAETVASATTSRSVIRWTCSARSLCSIEHVDPVTPRTFPS